jgi:hypothetical protein
MPWNKCGRSVYQYAQITTSSPVARQPDLSLKPLLFSFELLPPWHLMIQVKLTSPAWIDRRITGDCWSMDAN